MRRAVLFCLLLVAPVSAGASLAVPIDDAPQSTCPSARVFDDGRYVETRCVEAFDDSWIVVDLSDGWTPALFNEDPSIGDAGRQPFRDRFVRLSNEHFGRGWRWSAARADRYFELFGVFPSPSVLHGRLADGLRHRCHEQVDDRALSALKRAWLGGCPRAGADAIRAAQAHLVCEDMLPRRGVDGSLGPTTARALDVYKRRHMLASRAPLGAEVIGAMVADSRELDYRAALRTLRERVVDATGLLADGTAVSRSALVMGRELDPPGLRDSRPAIALIDGAPDRVGRATDLVARELGWWSAREVEAFLDDNLVCTGAPLLFAVRVDVVRPKWRNLRVEIDRGDVWYDREPKWRPRSRLPTLTVYGRTESSDEAIVRWPTTIGGWQKEQRAEGDVVYRYKPSFVGAFFWRDMLVAPTWYPPETTPDRRLMWIAGEHAGASYLTFGPGYRSAFGLVALKHHQWVHGDEPRIIDRRVRTHGTRSYGAVLGGGFSNGCHRLLPHHAVRLGSFLLSHRPHTRRGPVLEPYQRTLRAENHVVELKLENRGTLFEFDPPIIVDVVAGRVRGRWRSPPVERVPIEPAPKAAMAP